MTIVIRIMTTFALAASLCAAAPAQAAQSTNIEIKNFMFTPATVTAPAGDTVTWRNDDEEPHTVTSDSGLFRSGGLDTGQTFSFKFDKPGTYHYVCSIHPQMQGTITVK